MTARFWVAWCVFATGFLAAQSVVVRTTPELRAALRAARPGARVLLAPGVYDGFSAEGVRGVAGKPITVAAEKPASRPVVRGGVHFASAAFLELRDLDLEGAPHNGLNIDDGGRPTTPAEGVVVRGLRVRDCGGRGNEDGVKLSGLARFVVAECTVERWGRGGSAFDLVGCVDGVIEECRVVDREQGAASSGVQMKGGCRAVTVRRCRFEHAGERALNLGGSTGREFFRPRPQGYEAKDLVVEDCVIVGSTAPFAFVGVDGAIVRRNTLYRPRKWVLRILQETRAEDFLSCRGGVFEDNLVVYRADEVRTPFNVGPGTAPETFRFARNYWHCVDDPLRGAPAAPTPESEPRGGGDPRFVDPEHGDYRLRAGSPAAGAGARAR